MYNYTAATTTVAVSVPFVILTAIISSVLTSLIACCIKYKGDHTVVNTGVIYNKPVVTTTGQDMKDNMAYGQVEVENIDTPAVHVYDTVYN